MDARTPQCENCGITLPVEARGRPRKFCSDRCRQAHRKISPGAKKVSEPRKPIWLSWRAGRSLGLLKVLANEPGRGAKRSNVAMLGRVLINRL